MKRLFATLLAVLFALALNTAVFADEPKKDASPSPAPAKKEEVKKDTKKKEEPKATPAASPKKD
ncbi:MAG: hypothetical protein HQL03_10100 [Nitrospirae bacterium]|nr:hypothetical protein [Nitrospirota bacterium]MBF0592322.1 hypothetical protein [Nitrospirota bacterium]